MGEESWRPAPRFLRGSAPLGHGLGRGLVRRRASRPRGGLRAPGVWGVREGVFTFRVAFGTVRASSDGVSPLRRELGRGGSA